MATNNSPVKFVYVLSTGSLPSVLDPDTVYWIEKDQQILVGPHLISDHTQGLLYKGSVPSVEDLPTEDAIIGDTYLINGTGLYVFNGMSWDYLEFTAPDIDVSLTKSGFAADSKSVGDQIADISTRVEDLEELTKDTSIDPDDLGLYQDEETFYVYPVYRGVRSENGIPLAGGSGGGGGGGGNNATLTVTNTSGWLSKSISLGADCYISISWSSIEADVPTGDGTLVIQVGGVTKRTQNISQGSFMLNVAEYLSSGTNKIKFKVSDVYDNSRTITYTVTVVDLTISSSFDVSGQFHAGSTIEYTYTPVGSVEKLVHFLVDGVQIGTATVLTSGRQQSYTLPAMSHGMHSLTVYFTADIEGSTVRSNDLYYELIVVDVSSRTPIITCPFRRLSASQYETLQIPYTVYTPNLLTSAVDFYADGELISSLTIDRTQHIFSYRADVAGPLVISISSGGVTRSISLTVLSTDIDVSAETDSLALHLSSYGRSNSEDNPGVWKDVINDIHAELTGFNFVSDGWISDNSGYTALRVSGDARVTVQYKPFAQDFRSSGKTIELEFASRDILNYDSTLISCMSGGRGFQLTAQKAILSSEQSEISTQYKEDEHVRISFVVEKRTESRLLYIYINGIMSGVVQYPDDDDFSQTDPVNITIGSNYCTTDVYCIRIYDNNLTRYQILDNWIADTQDITTLLARYTHNNIYDGYGSVVIDKLPVDLPYMVLSAPQLPQYKGDKKTISGYFVNPVDPSKSFSFEGASADVQGTSSQYYPRKNYKIKFNGGFTMTESGETVSKFAMNSSAVPTKTFTFKADVASSEGANNVELVRLYDAVCPYKTPPQKNNNKIRQGIDGFPIVMFWDSGDSVSFVGKYNFNNDKGTEEVFGFNVGDESWEIKNNTSDRVLWKNDNFEGSDWLNDFEGRYPDGSEDATNLSQLASWLVSTDQTAASGEELADSYTDADGNVYMFDTAAYRLAKFKTEAEDYLEMDSTVFYYLFTELFLMVDSRAKNAFPSFFGTDGWCWLPYDFDTAIGINNEGALVFDYSLEDTDHLESGADIFNGQQSVLWINLREAFRDRIQSMYQDLRSTGSLSYQIVETAFEQHQSKWPEAIFNEDAWFKYIDPLVVGGSGAYLAMAQGSKAEQRKWWLYNRFRYIDSKYNAGDALTDVIQIRGYAKSNVTVVPYADIYPSVKYGSYLVSQRGARNQASTLICPLDSVNDTEIYIYSASQLASVGDLSGFKVGFADFSMATKLQNIKVGDSDPTYTNGNLTEFYVGNNTLLNSVDVRNCFALTGSVDLSGATNVEHVYFDGTSITSCSLPIGGILKTLSLPETITNLTIRNQSSLVTFYMPSYSRITTLRIENCGESIPIIDILHAMSASSRIRILGATFNMNSIEEVESLFDYLDTMRGLDEHGNNVDHAVISGTIDLDADVESSWIDSMHARYPNVVIEYNHLTSNLKYYNYDGTELLYAEIIVDGGDGTYAGQPYRPTTEANTYEFIGWSLYTNQTVSDENATKHVTSDRSVYAAYSVTGRTYTVRFYNEGTLLQTVDNVPYGETATYTGVVPIDPSGEGMEFIGWAPSNSNIRGETDCYAQFESAKEVIEIEDDWATILANVANGSAVDVYKVGNYKPLDLGSEGVVNMQIAAINKDTLASGGKATLSWISVELLNTSYRMNLPLAYNTIQAPSWATEEENIWISQNRYAVSTARVTWTVTALQAGQLSISYRTSNETVSRNKITKFLVNGDTVAIDYADTTGGVYTTEVSSNDILTVYCEYSMLNDSYNYYAQVGFSGVDISVSADVANAETRDISSMISSTGSIGGWLRSDMRTFLKESIKSKIPEPVRSSIKPVIKTQLSYTTSGLPENQTTTDDVWIPSQEEVHERFGLYYTLFENNSENRKKNKIGSITMSWWLRSAGSVSSFYYIGSIGDGYTYSNNAYGIALGFCT